MCLASYGNSFLAGKPIADFYPGNSVFRFCKCVGFVDLESSGNESIRSRLLASAQKKKGGDLPEVDWIGAPCGDGGCFDHLLRCSDSLGDTEIGVGLA